MRYLVLLLLTGCASIFGPDDWEPSGHWTVASNSPLGPIALYRPNPAEKPIIERVEVSEGKFVDVKVWVYKCIGGDVDSSYSVGREIFLCNKPFTKPHELAHQKGMRHTEWQSTGVGKCSTITVAGYKTDYKVGQEICVVNDTELK